LVRGSRKKSSTGVVSTGVGGSDSIGLFGTLNPQTLYILLYVCQNFRHAVLFV
jgi:hypothetical protein